MTKMRGIPALEHAAAGRTRPPRGRTVPYGAELDISINKTNLNNKALKTYTLLNDKNDLRNV